MMQDDGNLVIYKGNGPANYLGAIWSIQTGIITRSSTISLKSLSQKTGISLKTSSYKIASYTDPLTLPQTKLECSRYTAGICVTTKWYKKVMNCQWNVIMPPDFIADYDIDMTSIVNATARNIVSKTNELFTNAFRLTLGEATLASVIPGLASGGTAAATAFIATFEARLTPNMQVATEQLKLYLASLAPMQDVIYNLPSPKISESCGWSDWVPM